MNKEVLCDQHKTATTLDEVDNTQQTRKNNVIKNYIDENGSLKNYPSKEKKKIIVLEEIAKNFSKGKMYSEKEVKQDIKRIFEDFCYNKKGFNRIRIYRKNR